MKKMFFYEPAMCCSTGLCGVGVDPELLRIAMVLNALKKHGIEVTRYNLTNAPMEFVKNDEVNRLINSEGVESLPVTVWDGKIVKQRKYPTNEELCTWLEVPARYLSEDTQNDNEEDDEDGCCCCCCGGKR